MSKSYLLHVGFDYTEEDKIEEKLKKFFIDWCGEDQIYRVYPDLVICEMGCSSGVDAWDTMCCLFDQLKAKGFKVERDMVICWSLHPDHGCYLTDINGIDCNVDKKIDEKFN